MKKPLNRKIVSLLLILCISIAFSVPSFAITDSSSSRVESGKNDIIDSIGKKENLVSASQEHIKFSKTKALGTSINAKNLPADADNATIQSFVQETVDIIPKDQESYNTLMSIIGSGNSNITAYDSSYTVALFTNVYYDKCSGYQYGVTYFDISRITGGYTISGSNGTTVVGGTVEYYQTGNKATDNNIILTQHGTLSTTSRNWTINYPSSWIATCAGAFGYVGCSYSLTLQRPGGHQWEAVCANYVDG